MVLKNAVMAGVLALPALGVMAPQTVHAAPVMVAHDRPGQFVRGDVVIGKTFRHSTPRQATSRAADTHTLTFDVLDRTGGSAPNGHDKGVFLTPLSGGGDFFAPLTNGHGKISVPDGDYVVFTQVDTTERSGATSSTLIYRPKVSVTGDMSLVLDARTAKPVQVTTDRKDAKVVSAAVVLSLPGNGGVVPFFGKDLYVTPTGTGSGPSYRVQARLTRNGAEMGSPYIYNVAASADGIPADPGLRVRTKDLAAVRTTYAAEGGSGCAGTHAGVDWGIGTVFLSYAGTGVLPADRVEYFTPGLNWSQDEGVTTGDCAFAGGGTDSFGRQEAFPRAGSYTRRWNTAPFGPGAGYLYLGAPDPESMMLEVPMLSDREADSGRAPYPHTTGTSTLRDSTGAVVDTADQPGWARSWRWPAPGKYSLTVDSQRSAPWSDLASRQHVVWDLDIGGRGDKVTLPAVRYGTALDARDRARARAQQTITLVPDGLVTSKSGTPEFWVSYDDGKTWRPVAVRTGGQQWTVSFRNPPSGRVSLRTRIPGVVDQTVIDAYGIA